MSIEDKLICSQDGCSNQRDWITYPKCKDCRNKVAQKRQDKRVENGLCFRCGKNPIQETNNVPPSKSCQPCNERNTAIRSGAITTTPKIRGEFCSKCSHPRDNNSSWCNDCMRLYRSDLTSKRLCYDCRLTLNDPSRRRCDDCNIKRNNEERDRRRTNKLKLVEFFNSRCCDCGLVDDICVYQFHHLNRELKEIEVSKLLAKNWKLIMKEVDKGVLMLCANCHCKRTAQENIDNRKG